MSKKGAKQDDMVQLVEAVQDEKVISAIIARLSPSLNSIIEGMFAKLSENFATTFRQTLENFAVELVESATSTLTSKVTVLEDENKKLNQRVNDLENINRLNNLIVYGLPEMPVASNSAAEMTTQQFSTKSNHDETTVALELCRSRLGLEIDVADISFAHRISRGGKEMHRPILIGFASRRARDQVYSARRTLRSSSSNPNQVYINEHLTKSNAHIYALTRKMVREKKIYSTWSAGGLIFTRKTISPDEKPTRVNSISELDESCVN